MTSIAHLATALQTLFGPTADRLARGSGFVRRQRCLTGASFAQTLVCGWLAQPASTLGQLAQAAATAATPVSRQALHQRFTFAAATFLRALLAEAVSAVVTGDAVALPLLRRFPAVVVLDSTTIALPAALVDHWQGCGNGRGASAAALKVQAQLDLGTGGLTLQLQDGRSSDRPTVRTLPALPPGSLPLFDLGYFAVPALAALVAQGQQVLSRLLTQTALYTPAGARLLLTDLLAATSAATLDRPLLLGAPVRWPCRFLAQRLSDQMAALRLARQAEDARRAGTPLPPEARALSHWLLLVTSLPPNQLTLDEAFVLYRLRWQVELLFKRWKSLGRLDTWRTRRPARILCEVYAKLLGAVLTHWLIVVAGWQRAEKSLWQATQAVQGRALALLSSFRFGLTRLKQELRLLVTILVPCRMTARKARPLAYQRVLALTQPP
jgi:DDE family transposase